MVVAVGEAQAQACQPMELVWEPTTGQKLSMQKLGRVGKRVEANDIYRFRKSFAKVKEWVTCWTLYLRNVYNVYNVYNSFISLESHNL